MSVLGNGNVVIGQGVAAAPSASAQTSTKAGLKTIEINDPLTVRKWDDLLPKSLAPSCFHASAWAETLHSTYGYTPVYFVRRVGESIGSLLAVMEVRSRLTGNRGISLPFSDFCEPLASDQEEFSTLFNAAVHEGKKRDWKYLEIRGGRRFMANATPSCEFFVHELPLLPDVNRLLAGTEPAVRRAVRRAEHSGLRAEIRCDLEAMKIFYRLQCLTRRKHGLPPQPWSFFSNILAHILSNDLGFMSLASLGDKAVAGAVFFRSGCQAVFKYGAADDTYAALRGNNLAMWEGIRHCAALGLTILHFGRSSISNEGLRRFKRGWGAVESRCEYFRYDLRGGAFVTARDEAFGWHNRLFRLLPAGLSRIAGKVLYRHVA